MMKKEKGFTLIELLAVIVILGIITVIAVPKILDIINKSRNSAVNSSLKLVKDAIKTQIASSDLTGPVFTKETDGCYVFNFDDQTTGNSKELSIKNKDRVSGSIKYCNNTFSDDTLKFNGKEADNEKVTPVSFETDDWATISKAVKSASYPYKVGDTKEIDMGEFGKHTLRIANTSTPEECNTEGFSETACGFVVEFADIIASHVMSDVDTNVGGWEDSEMRTYVNNDVYNSLPSELKGEILTITVISGYGQSDSNNFTTQDKLYLLSTEEVWGKNFRIDTANLKTRQLDYYNISGGTNESAVKNYKENASYWWLRSAVSESSSNYNCVVNYGGWNSYYATNSYGVSPAFRIG